MVNLSSVPKLSAASLIWNPQVLSDALKTINFTVFSLQIDFWRPPSGVNSIADIMIDASHHGIQFLQFLRKNQLKAKILVDDLSKFVCIFPNVHFNFTNPLRFIEEKEIAPIPKHKLIKSLRSENNEGILLRDDVDADSTRFDGFGLRMGDYHDFNDITTFMQAIQNALPRKSQIRTIGWSVEGRPIQGIQVNKELKKKKLWQNFLNITI